MISNRYISLFFLPLAMLGICYYLRFAITPFIISLIVAYLTMPAVNFAEKYKIPRGITSLIIILIILSIFFYAFILLIPFVINKFTTLVNSFDIKDINQQHIHDVLISNFAIIGADNILKIENAINNVLKNIVNVDFGYIFNKIKSSSTIAMNILVVLIPCPIITFYMLRDWQKMIKKIYSTIPKRYVCDFIEITDNIGSNLSKYLRGQFQVCLFLSVFYSIPLYLIGLNFGIPIGIMTGCLAFIPYIGVIISAVITAAVAIVQFGDAYHVFLVLGVLMAGQAVDGAMITPRIIGEKVNIHPTWVILGLFISIVLFGTIGAIFALPLTACGSVIVKFAIKKYTESNYYTK